MSETSTDVSDNAAEVYDEATLSTNSTIIITSNATTSDSGTYTCTASFSGTEIIGNPATVAVYGKHSNYLQKMHS